MYAVHLSTEIVSLTKSDKAKDKIFNITITLLVVINQWCQLRCSRSCTKKHCNIDIDRENKSTVVVLINLSYFDKFKIYSIWITLQKLIGIKKNNVTSTNPFVLLAMNFACYSAHIIKSFYYQRNLSLTRIFFSNIIKDHWRK